MTKGTVVAVCKSEQTGTRKETIASGTFVIDHGLWGDAHATDGIRRQVSLLAEESIAKMKQLGADVGPGDFAENLTISGLELHHLPPGTQLRAGEEVVLEITEIGKACHKGCAIFEQVGDCVMPREGVFARVIAGGLIRAGDSIEVIERKDDIK